MLMPLNVEEQTLVPHRVARVSNDSSAENLLTKADDAEWIHIPACSGHVSPPWEIVGGFHF